MIAHILTLWAPVLVAPFIGSFLSVLLARPPTRGAGSVLGRPKCPHCDHPLAAADLIPIASWFFWKGRCRYCGTGLSPADPALELGAVIIAVWGALEVSPDLVWTSCILGWSLLALAIIDARHLIHSDALTFPLLVAGLLVIAWDDPTRIWHHVAGAICGVLVFGFVRSVYRRLRHREGLRLGDVKLFGAAGAWVSWEGLPGVVLWASMAGIGWLAARVGTVPPVELGDHVPFSSFLCVGIWLVWLYGSPIVYLL